MRFGQGLHALWGSDDAHEFDVDSALFFEDLDRFHSGAAGCEHWVQHDDFALMDVGRQLAVVGDRLQGLRVAVHADVAYLGSRNHREHALQHADAGAQDRDEGQLSAGDDLGLGDGDWGLHLDLLERQVAGGLVAHQHRDFADQLAEFLGAGVLVAQQGEFVLNQWVV